MASEGDRKVERLRGSRYDDLTVDEAVKELEAHGWSRLAVEAQLFGEGIPIRLDDSTTYTGLTLRWV